MLKIESIKSPFVATLLEKITCSKCEKSASNDIVSKCNRYSIRLIFLLPVVYIHHTHTMYYFPLHSQSKWVVNKKHSLDAQCFIMEGPQSGCIEISMYDKEIVH